MSNGRFLRTDEPSVGSILADIRDEVRDFLQTRVLLLRSEMAEKFANLKPVLPMAIAAALLAVTAYLLFSFAIVAAVSTLLLSNPYHWALSALIVGGTWLVVAVIMGSIASRRLKSQNLTPQKTLNVLRADKIWVESETKQTQ